MRRWLILALSVLICLMVYGGLKKFGVTDESLPQATPVLYIQDCSPSRGSCPVSVHSTTLQIQLQPPGLPAMVPLILHIGGETLDEVQLLRAWFEGRDMAMGRHELVPLKQDDGAGVIMLRGVIPVCTVNPKMMWQLKLLLQIQNTQQLIVFDLATDAVTE